MSDVLCDVSGGSKIDRFRRRVIIDFVFMRFLRLSITVFHLVLGVKAKNDDTQWGGRRSYAQSSGLHLNIDV